MVLIPLPVKSAVLHSIPYADYLVLVSRLCDRVKKQWEELRAASMTQVTKRSPCYWPVHLHTCETIPPNRFSCMLIIVVWTELLGSKYLGGGMYDVLIAAKGGKGWGSPEHPCGRLCYCYPICWFSASQSEGCRWLTPTLKQAFRILLGTKGSKTSEKKCVSLLGG